MTSLTEMKCVACRGGEPTVTDDEIAGLHLQVPEWKMVEIDRTKRLERPFKNFTEALKFSNQIGELAEAEGHHPAIFTEWGKSHRHMADTQNQRTKSKRLHHGSRNRQNTSAVTYMYQ